MTAIGTELMLTAFLCCVVLCAESNDGTIPIGLAVGFTIFTNMLAGLGAHFTVCNVKLVGFSKGYEQNSLKHLLNIRSRHLFYFNTVITFSRTAAFQRQAGQPADNCCNLYGKVLAIRISGKPSVPVINSPATSPTSRPAGTQPVMLRN